MAFPPPEWNHFDEWDIPIFIAGLAGGMLSGLALDLHPLGAGPFGLLTGCFALHIRRMVTPGLVAKKSGPPPPPLTIAQILLVSLGGAGILMSILTVVLGVAIELRPWIVEPAMRSAVRGFALAFVATGVVPLVLVRWLRRRPPG